jgi:hypothetical protein
MTLAVAALVGGCGGSTTASQSTVAASAAQTSAATAATTTAPQSTSPELIVCEEETASRDAPVSALSGGPEGVTMTPVTTFSGLTAEGCVLSPDLSKFAEISDASDGSKVAGYLPAGGGAFVNLSGHNSNGYSDTPVIDMDPVFNPMTGDLWWTEESGNSDRLWSAHTAGSAPVDQGSANLGGNLAGFTASGEPVAVALVSSPDGSLAAFTTKEVWHEDGIALEIGSAKALTASCTRHPTGCGLAEIQFLEGDESPPPCETFLGFASDTAIVCQNEPNGTKRFDRLEFQRAGKKIKVTSDAPLTPPTQMLIGGVRISPDGKTLWYTATRQASQTESSPEAHLYIVSTGRSTAEPSPVSLQPEMSLSSIIMAGWRWHGHFSSAG